MEQRIACLFPGQGAQIPGMGRDFFEEFLTAREVFQEADDRLEFSLSNLIFSASPEELALTKYSQPAIYVVSLAILRTIEEQLPSFTPHVCAGLSLGEYSALVAAKFLPYEQGLDVVNLRGNVMHETASRHPGSMQVVLGMAPEEVMEVCESVRKDPEKGVWVANLNCPGQVVIAGSFQGVDEAAHILKSRGARKVLPLNVSGAFHTPLMETAQNQLSPVLHELPLTPSTTSFVMNVTGDFVSSLDEIRHNLTQQVVSPVYWEKGVRKIAEEGIDIYLEIGCGKTLSGMNRKMGLDSPMLNVAKVEDLDLLSQRLIGQKER